MIDRNHDWVESYLSNKRSFIEINGKEITTLETMVVLNFRTTPILLSVNNLKNASNTLDPIMFVDDINLFFTYQDIRYLFQIDSKPRIRKHQPMVCFK